MENRTINFEVGLQSDLFWDKLGDAEVQTAANHGFSFKEEHTRRLKKSIISFQAIQQTARDNGVLIAVENLTANEIGGTEDRFLELLDSLDPKVAGVCFDSSHANITPGTFEMFQRFRHKIITTHLSDNHGMYDEHRPPFTASIYWRKVLRLLLANGFRGPWLMEVTNGGNDPLDVLAQMELSVRTMKDLLQRIADDI
jgi:sugar phosphate isomerase/epimerase